MEKLAEQVLKIQAEIAAMTLLADAARASLLAKMQEEGAAQVVIPGAGYISFVKENIRTSLDSTEARLRLETAGIAIPINVTNIKASLRIHLNK